jgi:hypothetical protein
MNEHAEFAHTATTSMPSSERRTFKRLHPDAAADDDSASGDDENVAS